LPTLNIKNFPATLYRKLKARARREHRSMAQEVTYILSLAVQEPEQLSILNLRGLGSDLWQEPAADHVERERGAWD
jgi:plasmid stability protein